MRPANPFATSKLSSLRLPSARVLLSEQEPLLAAKSPLRQDLSASRPESPA